MTLFPYTTLFRSQIVLGRDSELISSDVTQICSLDLDRPLLWNIEGAVHSTSNQIDPGSDRTVRIQTQNLSYLRASGLLNSGEKILTEVFYLGAAHGQSNQKRWIRFVRCRKSK